MDANLMDRVTDQDLSPFLPTHGKDEMNFAEHPIALLTDRVPKGQRSLIYEDTVYSQRRRKLIPRKRVIEGSQEYGLPTATDDTVILALIQLTKLKNDFSQREVDFTRLELIHMLGWPNEGKSYDRIKLSLIRIKGVQYVYDNAWWDVRLKDWTTRAFNIIDNVEINDSRLADAQGGLFPSRITWNEIVFESFEAGFLRNIDFHLCMRLKHPTALRMYRYLGKQFYAKDDLTLDLKAFAEVNLGLGRKYEGGTQIARKLKPAIQELEDVGFLEPLPEDQRFLKKGRDWSIRFIKKAPAPLASLPAAAPAAEAASSPLVEELIKLGVTAKTAAELAARYPADKIEQKLELLAWRTTQPKPPKDPAAYLVKSIIDDYAQPKGFVSRADRERQAQAHRQAEQQQAEQRRRHQAEEARAQERRRQEDAYWSTLTPAEQADLEAKALAAISEEARDTYLSMKRMHAGGDGYLSMIRREYIRGLLAEAAAEETA
jgi:Replication initiator protein A